MAGRPTAIVNLQETSPQGKMNWLIYADSGEGKTCLAGTASRGIFLTTEAAGTESAKALGSTADEWVCPDWLEFQKAFAYIKKDGIHEFDWVMIDSISEMEELAWVDQLEAAHKRNKSRSLWQPAISDYQVIGNKMKRTVDQFNRLPINVLYTAQTMRVGIEDDTSDEDTTKLMPLLGSVNNGIISQKVCGKVTLVGLLHAIPTKKKVIRRLWLQGGKRYIAKDRHDTFPRYLDNTSIPEMMEAVLERQARAGSGGGNVVSIKKKKSAN